MNRNITIVVIILILVVIAGYLVWLRSNYQTQVTPEASMEEVVPEVASPSAALSPTPSKGQTATSGATTR